MAANHPENELKNIIMRARGVIFDLDGIILDSEPVHHWILSELMAPFGIPVSDEEYNLMIGKTDRDSIEFLVEKYRLPVSPEDLILENRDRMVERLKQGRVPAVPGTASFVRRMKELGKRLAVASSSPRENVRYSLRCAGLENMMEATCSGEDVRLGKPDPEIYLLAAARLGLPPGECVAVEDADAGILAANRAGMRAIGYRNPSSGIQTLEAADVVIDDFEKAVRIVGLPDAAGEA